MTDTTMTKPTTADELLALVDRLEGELTEHENAATAIRVTLDGLRKRLAQAPGARAGKRARSGKRKMRPLPFEGGDGTGTATAGAQA